MSTKEQSKYDPNRRFRKGDKVRVVEWNGRIPLYLKPYINTVHPVSFDEDINGYIRIEGDIEIANVPYLELVTPVEELDLYFVLDSPNTYNVCKRGEPGFAATFYKKHPLARKKADEYCEALNEEIRKEPQ